MRVSEVYASIQGEGPRVGQTTVFTRFGGCNLRCPGWPCDTQHAIDPAYRKEWQQESPDELYQRIRSVADISGAQMVTLTGGEPFLQPQGELEYLCFMLLEAGYQLEAFTNGTRPYSQWAVENISMIMDWKLPGSGEDPLNRTRYENLGKLAKANANIALVVDHAAKFVCKDEADFNVANHLWSSLNEVPRKYMLWYYGKVWNGDITDARLAELVMTNKLPWKLNVQLHNLIWPANERGR